MLWEKWGLTYQAIATGKAFVFFHPTAMIPVISYIKWIMRRGSVTGTGTEQRKIH